VSDFLEEVVRERRAYVAAARTARPLAEVVRAARRAAFGRGTPSFAKALRARRTEGRLAVIAEVKRTSPARGRLAEIADPTDLVHRYRDGGAVAISVLVEPHHWGGSLDDLRTVERATRTARSGIGVVEASMPPILPVLAKDVVVDEYQIAEAGAAGAHAVLLIAEIFGDAALMRLVDVARDLGMDALVEAHEPAAFMRALRSGAPAIGVNARDLREPSRLVRSRIHELAGEVVTDQVLVAESGITSLQDAQALPARVDAILVGTALVTARDPEGLVHALADVRPAKVLA
jgi:indole-3-glycerol phosphate synthase